MAECGYYTSAAKLLESSIQTFRAFGDSYGVFAAVSELGTVYGLLGYDQASSGQPDLAFASFMQAKAYFFESMQLRFEAVAVDRMNIIRQNMMELAKSMLIAGEALWSTDSAMASRFFQEVLEIARQYGATEFLHEIQDRLRPYGFIFFSPRQS